MCTPNSVVKGATGGLAAAVLPPVKEAQNKALKTVQKAIPKETLAGAAVRNFDKTPIAPLLYN